MVKRKCEGYSIWVMPTGIEYMKLSNLIFKLSKKYNFPHFHPHITLIGKVRGEEQDLIKKTEQLASQIQPYSVKLFVPDYHNDSLYYKSLFLDVAKTKEVMGTNVKAQKIFNKKEEYSPHLSLGYGDIPASEKILILSNIKEDYFEFKVDKLHLFLTSGGAKSWYKIRDFPLSKHL